MLKIKKLESQITEKSFGASKSKGLIRIAKTAIFLKVKLNSDKYGILDNMQYVLPFCSCFLSSSISFWNCLSKASLGSSLILALFLIFLARLAYLNVLIDSSKLQSAGPIFAICNKNTKTKCSRTVKLIYNDTYILYHSLSDMCLFLTSMIVSNMQKHSPKVLYTIGRCWCLTPLSTRFHLNSGYQFYW